jgi:exodeoxyribonuclease-3
MEGVLSDAAWVDAFRVVNQQPHEFTYWSNFQNAFERNNGWRIDYQLTTPDLRNAARTGWIERSQRFSDHAPVVIEYEL